MTRRAFSLAAMMIAALTVPAYAQPAAVVTYDLSKTQTLMGTVKALDWMNPSSVLSVAVKDPKTGRDEIWSLRLAAPERAIKSGWMHNSLKPGDPVTLTLHPARNGSRIGQLVSVALPDGTVLGGDEPVTPEPVPG